MRTKYIKDPKTGENILPITSPSAVIDENGTSINTRLTNDELKISSNTTRITNIEHDIDNTYTKQEVDNLITTPNVKYENYQATTETSIGQILPAQGESDTIYKIGSWDGTNIVVDTSVYSEYAWNGTVYKLLAVRSNFNEGVFNISEATGDSYETLSAALTVANSIIPSSKKKGGMSITFIKGSVQSSDNKYVQYRYMGTATTGSPNPFINTVNWQGVDDEPVAGSDNLVKSGGVAKELDDLNVQINGLPTISIEETLIAFQWYTLDTPIKAGREIKNNSSYTVYVYSNGVEQTSIPANTARTYDVDITQFRASASAGVYKIYVASVPSSVKTVIVNDYSGGTDKALSAEIGKELNQNVLQDGLSPFIVKRSHAAVSGMTQIETLSYKKGYSYRLSVYTDEVVSTTSDYYTQIYDGDTRITQAIIKANETSGKGGIIKATDDLDNLVLRSEINVPFTYVLEVFTDTDTFINSDVLRIRTLKDYGEEPLLLDKYYSGSDTDYNPMIEELFIPKEYRNDVEYIAVRNYNNYLYLVARDVYNGILWTLTVKIDPTTPNNTVLQLTSTTEGSSEVAYVLMKDVAAFRAAGTDIGNGQGVNLDLAYRLFSQDKIRNYLKQNLPANISVNTEDLQDGCVTLDKVSNGVSLAKGVQIVLPDDIYAINGDCLQIFFRGIINASNPYIYDVIVVSSKGKSYPRYWIYTPSVSDIGTTATLTIKVRDNNLHVVAQKTTTLHFIDKISSPSSNKNLLCIGASNTTAGLWVGELRRRLITDTGDGTPSNPIGLNLTNITFVGRKVGTSVNVPLEATGGWKVATYASQGERAFRFQVSGISQLVVGDEYTLNGGIFVIQEINVTEGSGNIRCTLNSSLPTIPASGILTRRTGSGDSTITYSSYDMETFSPFWNDNTNKLDFISYANAYCNGAIDVMLWHCGTNDIFSGFDIDIDRAISGYTAILRQFHIDFPNGKVIISSIPVASVIGGFGANYGASEYYNSFTFANQARKFVNRLVELCNDDEFSSFTEYCPALETYDSEYGYPVTDSPVNHRDSVTEKLGTNGVHYTTVGQKLIADALYRSINNVLI